jgi:UDP-N-acetylglucosamine/UDP-N-acetylgalactosamine diphosphorylase
MDFDTARDVLERNGQAHVLRFWNELDETRRAALLAQIEALDFEALARMRSMLAEGGSASAGGDFPPAPVVELDAAARAAAVERGEAELRAGKVGVVLVAGGQGSRLGFDGPKGAYPIGPVSGMPLFYFHARKILALVRRYGKPVPWYIMTSHANHDATLACFEEFAWVGLDPEDVFLFRQGMWPALDDDGRILLADKGTLFLSPDGHGGTLAALRSSGALADMRERGISTVFYFQVDNPMIEMCDPAFLGAHLAKGAEMSVKVCAKRNAEEGLGVVVERDGACAIVEYSELTPEQMARTTASGELYYKYGSVALHVFSLDFLLREADRPMPIHLAHKKIACCDPDGVVVAPDAPNGWKFEKFIFDLLPAAANVLNLAFDRREEFSPVKNAEGADSPATCRRDLVAKWARWLDAAGIDVPRDAGGAPAFPIEIDPCFADSGQALAAAGLSGIRVDGPLWLAEEAPEPGCGDLP